MLFMCCLCGFFVGTLFVNLFSSAFETVVVCYLIQRSLKTDYQLHIGSINDDAYFSNDDKGKGNLEEISKRYPSNQAFYDEPVENLYSEFE